MKEKAIKQVSQRNYFHSADKFWYTLYWITTWNKREKIYRIGSENQEKADSFKIGVNKKEIITGIRANVRRDYQSPKHKLGI